MTVSYEQNDKVKAKFKHFMEKHIGMLPAPVFIFELSALILHNLSLVSAFFSTFVPIMEKKRILVVDDEQDLCDILLYNLAGEGYEAESAGSAEEALAKLSGGQVYDLLLLDVMMPGMSGFELAGRLRQDEATARMPVIFLTARDTETDMLQGFSLGADDYVRKPFSVRELMARVKAVMGRSLSQHKEGSTESYEGLVVDLGRKTVTVDGEDVALTKTELELLLLLLSRRGQVLTRQQLLEGAWPKDVVVTGRTVDVNVARLRKKIGRYSQNVVARQGYGYLFEVTA